IGRYVRTYANNVELDVAQLMAEVDAELGQNKKFREAPPISGPPRGIMDFLMLQLSKLDWRKGLIALGMIVAVLVAGSIFLVWRHYRTADPLAELKPGVYHSTQSVS